VPGVLPIAGLRCPRGWSNWVISLGVFVSQAAVIACHCFSWLQLDELSRMPCRPASCKGKPEIEMVLTHACCRYKTSEQALARLAFLTALANGIVAASRYLDRCYFEYGLHRIALVLWARFQLRYIDRICKARVIPCAGIRTENECACVCMAHNISTRLVPSKSNANGRSQAGCRA